MQATPLQHHRSGLFPEGFRILLLACVLTIFASSCKSLRNAQPPVVDKISGFEVDGMRDGKLQFHFKTRLHNPDRLRFKIRKVEMDLQFNGVRVAQVSTQKKMTIRRTIYPEIDWNVAGELAPLLSNPGKLIGSIASGKVDFDLDGSITISKWGFKKTLPFKLRLPVTIPLR